LITCRVAAYLNNGIQLTPSTLAIFPSHQQMLPALLLPSWSVNLLGSADTGR